MSVFITNEIFDLLMKLERTLGQRDDWGPWHPKHTFSDEYPDSHKPSVIDVDFEVLTKKLTGLLATSTFAKYISDSHLPWLDSFDRINKTATAEAQDSECERIRRIASKLKADNVWMRSSLQFFGNRANFLHLSNRPELGTQIMQAIFSTTIFNFQTGRRKRHHTMVRFVRWFYIDTYALCATVVAEISPIYGEGDLEIVCARRG